MDKETFNIDYFIEKFTNIPEEEWGIAELCSNGRCCALGHCGLEDYRQPNDESIGLLTLFAEGRNFQREDGTLEFSYVYSVNDEPTKHGDNPKANILNKLKELKEKEYGN